MDHDTEKFYKDLDNEIWNMLRNQGYQENPEEARECIELMAPYVNRGIDFDDPEKKARFLTLMQNILNRMMPGTQMFVRDCLLSDEVSALYVPKTILREPGFVDASERHGGLLCTHRVMIISNHMIPLPESKGWGAYVAPRNSYYKVLANYVSGVTGKRLILLLHLPLDGSWKIFEKVDIGDLGGIDIEKTSIERFEKRHIEPNIPELATVEWLKRCIRPVGIDDKNIPYPLEDQLT